MKLGLKTITGLDPELVASSQLDPASIVMELEARFNREEPETFFDDLQIVHGLMPRLPRAMLRRQFGKWLPKGAETIIADTSQYLTEHAKERGYPVNIDDLIASTVFNIQRIEDLEKWKTEQTVIRRAQRHYLKQETSKQLVDGKRQWVNAEVYELPPLMQSEGKSLKHQDARYAIRLPDGRYFDLGQTADGFKPIMSDGPDIAMQRIAKRAGLETRGGAHTILQKLTGFTDIIPAYTTVWHRHQWLVIVGWQRDPKLTPSSYYLGEGQLSRSGMEADRLTMSELDYHLLKGAAETEIQDEEGQVVDHMNEEEELVEQAFDLTDHRATIDLEKFDDDEMELFNFLASKMDMSQFTQGSLGLLQCKEADELLEGELVETETGTQYKGGLYGAMRMVNMFTFLQTQQGTQEIEDALVFWKSQVARFKRMLRIRRRLLIDNDTKSFVSTQEPGAWNMRGTDNGPPLMEPVKTTPEMGISPANKISISHKIVEVDKLPPHRTSVMHRVKRSTDAIVGFDIKKGKPVTKHIKNAPQAPLNPRNASPKLKEKLRAIIREELETGTLEQEVADTFAIALEQALRGALRA